MAKKARKLLAILATMAGWTGLVQGFFMAMSNEGARMVPDGLPLDPAVEVMLVGILFFIVAMLIWPHPGGLRNYLREIK